MADPESLCAACSKPQQQACGRCHCIRYCSKECQAADWPIHKVLCRAYSEFDFTTRPSPEHLLGILFSPDRAKPQLIWVHCNRYPCGVQSPDINAYTGEGQFSMGDIRFNGILKRQVPNMINLCYREEFAIDGSKSNQAIAELTKRPGWTQVDWKGPVLTYGMEGPGLDVHGRTSGKTPRCCRDLNLLDFRHIVDFLHCHDRIYSTLIASEYASNNTSPLPGNGSSKNFAQDSPNNFRKETDKKIGDKKAHGDTKKVKAVKINCLGDQKIHGMPPFEAVEILTSHPIFKSHDTSDIAARLELPILTRREPPDPAWKDIKDWSRGPFQNTPATFLHLSCRDDAKTGRSWGRAPMSWQRNVGSVLVVRKNKEPLHPLHVESLSRFCEFETIHLFEHSTNSYLPEKPISRDTVLQFISRPMFVIYWGKFWKKKMDENDAQVRKMGLWSPYYEIGVIDLRAFDTVWYT